VLAIAAWAAAMARAGTAQGRLGVGLSIVVGLLLLVVRSVAGNYS
jgi:hypothetical protein